MLWWLLLRWRKLRLRHARGSKHVGDSRSLLSDTNGWDVKRVGGCCCSCHGVGVVGSDDNDGSIGVPCLLADLQMQSSRKLLEKTLASTGMEMIVAVPAPTAPGE